MLIYKNCLFALLLYLLFFPLKDSVTKVHDWFHFLVLCAAAVLLGLALNTHCPVVTTKKCSDRKDWRDVRVCTEKKNSKKFFDSRTTTPWGDSFFFNLNFILRTRKTISLSAKAVSFLQNPGSKFRHNLRQNHSFPRPKIHVSAHALWSLEGCAHHFVVNKRKAAASRKQTSHHHSLFFFRKMATRTVLDKKK